MRLRFADRVPGIPGGRSGPRQRGGGFRAAAEMPCSPSRTGRPLACQSDSECRINRKSQDNIYDSESECQRRRSTIRSRVRLTFALTCDGAFLLRARRRQSSLPNHRSLELHNSIHLRRSQCSAPAEMASISLKVLSDKDLPRLYREKNVGQADQDQDGSDWRRLRPRRFSTGT